MDGFADAMRDAILSLPQDLKAMLRVLDDPDLDDSGRLLTCGALLHILSATNAIPGVKGTLALVDDVLVLRLALERIGKTQPEVVAAHHAHSPEIFDPWQGQLDAARSYLGEKMSVLDKAVDGLGKLNFQGHTARECAKDQESTTWLYDSVHEAIVAQFDIAEDEVARAVKNAHEIKSRLNQRVV